MTSTAPVRRALSAILACAGLVLGGLAVATPASADTRPADPTNPATPATVSADGLPTVQIDGVAWSQVVVGNTVYVAGRFTTARPAGAAAGVNTTPRNNLLAYDINTGNLITSFAPNLNAQALVVRASPDGSRIYVGGDFTQANGQPRYRIAAYSTATGALIPDFRPVVGSQVRSIAVSSTAVYVGGNFSVVGPGGSVPRTRLAAFNPANGSVLPWAPVSGAGRDANGSTASNYAVDALLVAPGGGRIIAAGRFGYLNGVATSGVGALDPVSGATVPFAIGQQITNQGDDASIVSLSADGDTVYGTGYDFGGPGNLEGVFAANPVSGAVRWIAECHGDHYEAFSSGGAVYTTSHSHVCSNIGGFPETSPRTHKNATAFSKAATGVVGTATFHGSQAFVGAPAPNPLAWYPSFITGTFTGQGQAGWTVTGNSQYVVYGGEFPGVNNRSQQGLIRFAIAPLAPNAIGPDASNGLNADATSPSRGTARVRWQATSDRDNENLTYRVLRNGVIADEQTVASTFYRLPSLEFTDSGLFGGTYTYQIQALDPFGNQVTGQTDTVTVLGDDPPPGGPLAEDGFDRSVTNGLGVADVGGLWTVGGSASNYAVNGGTAAMANTQGSTRSGYLNSVSVRDVAIQVAVSLDAAPTGGGVYVSVIGRHVGSNDYRAKLRFYSTGAVQVQLTRVVSGAETTLATLVVPGLTYAAGQVLQVRLDIAGINTATVRAKVWRSGSAEPAGWQVTATDSTSALRSAGGIGLASYLAGSSTNRPTTRFDDLWAGEAGSAPPF